MGGGEGDGVVQSPGAGKAHGTCDVVTCGRGRVAGPHSDMVCTASSAACTNASSLWAFRQNSAASTAWHSVSLMMSSLRSVSSVTLSPSPITTAVMASQLCAIRASTCTHTQAATHTRQATATRTGAVPCTFTHRMAPNTALRCPCGCRVAGLVHCDPPNI
jgi:hypothetical protein